jgi:hypothetical protein
MARSVVPPFDTISKKKTLRPQRADLGTLAGISAPRRVSSLLRAFHSAWFHTFG